MNVEWDKKDVWRFRRRSYSVEVTRHNASKIDDNEPNGVHRWAVYVYIYPDHPLFARFSGLRAYDWCRLGITLPTKPAEDFPMHGGASRIQRHFDGKNSVTSIEVGADYNHASDEAFTHMATAEEASQVFADAQRLVDFMEARAA